MHMNVNILPHKDNVDNLSSPDFSHTGMFAWKGFYEILPHLLPIEDIRSAEIPVRQGFNETRRE